MPFEFPKFDHKIPIDDTHAWTATFDSYDQRNDDCYYRVTLHVGAAAVARFYVCVNLWWAGDDWTDARITERIQEEIQAVAITGQPNTEYGSASSGTSTGRRSPRGID